MSERKVERCYRLPPCPPYDVEGTESWLNDMAHDGWILAEDGIFGGVATFEKSEPVNMKHRLTAAKKGTGLWSENNGDPDAEEIEHSAMYGWEYIARRDGFHIYRSADPEARELDTDPEVQVMALKMLRKRQRGSWGEWLFWIVYTFYRLMSGQLILSMIFAKSWFMLIAFGVVLWFLINSVIRALHYRKLGKKLVEQGHLDSGKNWRKNAASYQIGRFVRYGLVIALIMILFANITSTVLGEKESPIAEFREEPPFATITDFAEGEYELENYGSWANNVIHWSDWIAPDCWRWHEIAKVTTEDGIINGGLYIDYFETVSPAVAKLAAKEYYRDAKWERWERLYNLDDDFEILDVTLPEADFAVAYMDEIHMPHVILQRGNIVINASFHQYGDSMDLSIEEWAAIIGNSLKK